MKRAAAIFGACLALSCVDSSKSSAPGALAEFVVDAQPPDMHAVNLAYGGKVRLLGYKVSPETGILPGKDVKLTMYWQLDEKLDDGWLLFTHLTDTSGVRYAAGNIDNVGPLRDTGATGTQALPPSKWQKGKVYVDEQPFRVPDDAKTEVVVTTGIWRGDERMPVTSGPADKDGRGIVARLKIGAASATSAPSTSSAPPRPVPQLRAMKLGKGVVAPKIDGKLDDEAWKHATSTGALVDVTTGMANKTFPVNANVRITWDDKNMYLAFDVQDDKLVGGFKPSEVAGKDPHLWEKECVEIMADPDGDGDNKDYYEIQISPQNLVFDSQFDGYNAPRGGPDGPFGHQEWSTKAETAVKVDGTLDDDSDTDKGYTVEAAIPWASFTKAHAVPPRSGDTWRMNFYAMKRNGGVAWSPILGEGNFHKASRFGRVVWIDPSAPAAASSSPSSMPPASAPKPAGSPR